MTDFTLPSPVQAPRGAVFAADVFTGALQALGHGAVAATQPRCAATPWK